MKSSPMGIFVLMVLFTSAETERGKLLFAKVNDEEK